MERLEFKFKAEDVEATGRFTGYGAVFNNLDAHGDVIVPGAFKKSLRDWAKRKEMPPMLTQHGGLMITDMDAIPVGVWEEMSEDDTGLAVRGRIINLDTERGKTIYGAMKEGALKGMSIGYRAKRFTLGTKPEEPRRKLEEIDLVEVSVVTFPANERALISGVKADMTTEDFRDLEAALRMKGLSRTDAVKAVSGLREWLQREAGEPDKSLREEGVSDLVALLRRNIASLT